MTAANNREAVGVRTAMRSRSTFDSAPGIWNLAGLHTLEPSSDNRLEAAAIVFARVARSSEPADGPLAHRLTSVSDNLHAASEQLSRADSILEQHATDHGAGLDQVFVPFALCAPADRGVAPQ